MVELQDSGFTINVAPEQTLLQALQTFNVDIPSDCGEGLCGSCEVRVAKGEVDHRDMVLTASERQENDRMMACCSRAKSGRLVLKL
jgi:ferredoxin